MPRVKVSALVWWQLCKGFVSAHIVIKSPKAPTLVAKISHLLGSTGVTLEVIVTVENAFSWVLVQTEKTNSSNWLPLLLIM